jgi:predicted nucleic acid-binding protein
MNAIDKPDEQNETRFTDAMVRKSRKKSKVLVDTNVILDFVLQREHYAEAKQALAKEIAAKTTLLMSVGGFYTMLFVVDKYFRKDLQQSRQAAIEQTRDVMRKVLSLFTVAEHDNETLLSGINDVSYSDIEDSCQYQLALKHGCDKLMTFNAGDFPANIHDDVVIMSLC